MAKQDKLNDVDFKMFRESLKVAHDKYEQVEKFNIDLFREYFRGKQWNSISGNIISLYGTDHVTDNLIFSNIKTIMPAINFRNPKITVQAKKKPFEVDGQTFDTIAASIILEVILNYYFKELKTKKEVDKCLLDALVTYRGIMFTGYTVETEKIKNGEVQETNELIKSDSPFTLRISPRDFRSDPEGEDCDLTDARWIAIKWVKTLDEVKNNDKYENTKELKTNFTIKTNFGSKGDDTKSTPTTGESKLWDRVEGWDIWDKKTQRIITTVKGHDKPLQYAKWPLDYDSGFPTDILYFNENPDESLPIADVQIYIDSQDELNRLKSLQLEHVRKVSQRKYLSRAGALTTEEKSKLIHGGDGAILEVTEGSVDGALVPLQDASISQDLYITINGLKNSIREESGVSRIEAGGAEKFDTATEPALIAQGTENRRDDRSATLEAFLSDVQSKLGKVLQQTLRKRDFPLTNEQLLETSETIPDKIAKIAGQGSDVLMPWLTASKDDIQGEYEFDIQTGSTRPINQETRKRDATFIYQTLLQSPLINQEENLKRLLEAFPDVRSDMDKLLKPAEQASQEGQQAQQSAIQADIAVQMPKIQADLQKTQMKTAVQREKNESDAQLTLLTLLKGEDKVSGGEK